MLELVFRPMACSLAARISILEANLTARYTQVDLISKRIDRDGLDFLTLSPKGQVPVLVLPSGEVLTENSAVLQYIADQSPTQNLAPEKSSDERYRLQEWLSFIGTELHKAIVYPAFSPNVPTNVREHALSRTEYVLPIAAAALASNSYLLGDAFSVADAYLIWSLLLLQKSGVELGETLNGYLRNMQERPSVRDAIKSELSLL